MVGTQTAMGWDRNTCNLTAENLGFEQRILYLSVRVALVARSPSFFQTDHTNTIAETILLASIQLV